MKSGEQSLGCRLHRQWCDREAARIAEDLNLAATPAFLRVEIRPLRTNVDGTLAEWRALAPTPWEISR